VSDARSAGAAPPARCGILLHPAGHTLSPVLHTEAYRELGLRARYEVHDVPPAELPAALRRLAEQGVRQLSVSIPHKEAVLEWAHQRSEAVRAIGAANTLTWREGAIAADNTDWIGFTRAIEGLGPWRGRRATVIGAGGAARAIVYALRQMGCEVALVSRTPARAERLARELGAQLGSLADPCDLLVNATPVGMHPHVSESPVPEHCLRAGSLVFDSVYRPLETRLLREARRRGCRVEDGLGMLVQQAVEQVFLWSGRRPAPERLRAAAERALESGHTLASSGADL
jgi:shikimate dehydrogenase